MASDLHKYSVQESLNLMMNTGEDALKVDIDNVTLITEGSDVNIEVHIDQAEDSILAYGYDGSSNQKIKTDASGNVQVDIVSGSTATTEYSEDVATPSTIAGIAVMMERDNALGGLTPAEGDWAALRCDANGALWTRDDALDAVVSGSEMQVDIVGSLPAGSAAIGKLAANSGVDIGDVDVTSLPASTNTIEIVGDAAENAAVAGNPVLVGGRYDSSARTLGDGDVGAVALDADGAVHITDGGNALTVDGTVTANLSATDNAVLDSILAKNTEIDSVLTTIDADTGAIKTAVEIIDNAIDGSEMQVDVVTMPSVTVDSEFPAAATITDNFSNPSTTSVMSMGMLYDGSAWDMMKGDATNGALVNLGSNNDVTVSGTVTANLSATDNAVLDAMVVDLAALETLQTSTNTKLDTLETTLTAIETDQAAIEIVLGTIDADTGSIKTAVEIIDNAVHVDDDAFTLGSHSGVMMMGFAGTQSVNANDAGAIAMDTDGAIHIADGGNSITIDGTVTANLSATDNAVLDAMVVDLAAMEVLLTAANVDHAANEVLLGTIDADTNAIKTAVEIIDNAISGSEMQVDTVSTVQPAGHGAVAQFTTNIAGTATQLDAHACKHADVMGKIANVGIVYVGGSSVAATTGIALYPGDVYSVDVTNTNLLYGIAVNANDDLQVVYYN